MVSNLFYVRGADFSDHDRPGDPDGANKGGRGGGGGGGGGEQRRPRFTTHSRMNPPSPPGREQPDPESFRVTRVATCALWPPARLRFSES